MTVMECSGHLPAGLELIQGHQMPWPLMPSEMALMPFKIFIHLRPKISALFSGDLGVPVVILCKCPQWKVVVTIGALFEWPWMPPEESTPLALFLKCPLTKLPCPFEFLIRGLFQY